jgi:hypothetical protein
LNKLIQHESLAGKIALYTAAGMAPHEITGLALQLAWPRARVAANNDYLRREWAAIRAPQAGHSGKVKRRRPEAAMSRLLNC